MVLSAIAHDQRWWHGDNADQAIQLKSTSFAISPDLRFEISRGETVGGEYYGKVQMR
jgi:hypothetical protein